MVVWTGIVVIVLGPCPDDGNADVQFAPSFVKDKYPHIHLHPPLGAKLHVLYCPQSLSTVHSFEQEDTFVIELLYPGRHEQVYVELGTKYPVHSELWPHWNSHR